MCSAIEAGAIEEAASGVADVMAPPTPSKGGYPLGIPTGGAGRDMEAAATDGLSSKGAVVFVDRCFVFLYFDFLGLPP